MPFQNPSAYPRMSEYKNKLTTFPEELNLTLHAYEQKTIVIRKTSYLVNRKDASPEASFQKIGMEIALHQTGSLPIILEKQYREVSKSPPSCSIILFFQLNWGK